MPAATGRNGGNGATTTVTSRISPPIPHKFFLFQWLTIISQEHVVDYRNFLPPVYRHPTRLPTLCSPDFTALQGVREPRCIPKEGCAEYRVRGLPGAGRTGLSLHYPAREQAGQRVHWRFSIG